VKRMHNAEFAITKGIKFHRQAKYE
jgi:hypothetical protein